MRRRNHHPLFRRWTSIRQFKLNPNDPKYKIYENLDCHCLDNFKDFCQWIESEIGLPPTPQHKLNRIDQSQGWIPDNVRWATVREMSNNRTNNINIEYQNETHTLKEWSAKFNFKYDTLFSRYEMGWTPEEMFTISFEKGSYKIVR